MSPKPRRTHPPTNPEIYWLEVSRAEAEEMATQGTVPFAVRIDLQELIGKMDTQLPAGLRTPARAAAGTPPAPPHDPPPSSSPAD